MTSHSDSAGSGPYGPGSITAINLAAIAYSVISEIPQQVLEETGFDIVWGPAEVTSDGIPYNLMYVAKDPASSDYWVVIRGTTPESLTSWKEDFDVSTSVPFSTLPNAPSSSSSALVSQGTYDGMTNLLGLTDPTTYSTLVQYLDTLDASTINLYVTGHSLGGTLTPVMFAYLNTQFYGTQPTSLMNLWSFAGLTPGGSGFNNFLEPLLPSGPWRFRNNLDIAPHLFSSQTDIENIYSQENLDPSDPVQELLDDWFQDAGESGVGYAQPPQSAQVLPGVFDDSFPDEDSFTLQALHQHHHGTYQALVKGENPPSTADS